MAAAYVSNNSLRQTTPVLQATSASSSNRLNILLLFLLVLVLVLVLVMLFSSSIFLLLPSKRYLCFSLSLLRGRISMDRADIAGCWMIGSMSEGERALSGMHDDIECLCRSVGNSAVSSIDEDGMIASFMVINEY
jgi:hypothetical protein